jgi:hypothetical protein
MTKLAKEVMRGNKYGKSVGGANTRMARMAREKWGTKHRNDKFGEESEGGEKTKRTSEVNTMTSVRDETQEI